MNSTIIAAVVRHLLTAVGGGLAVKWGIDGGTWEAIVGGASAAAGLVWSVADKRRNQHQNPSF